MAPMSTSRYDILEIDYMLKRGKSLREIARHYQVNHGALNNWLKRKGYRVIEQRYIDPDTISDKETGRVIGS